MELKTSHPLTLVDREAGGALVDHLQKLGINVHTDIHQNRLILKEARQDHSEVGKIRYFKTESSNSYGFTYKGNLYLDLRKIDAELPLHEYAHLWVESLRRINPKNWEHVVTMIKQDTDSWHYVKGSYPELTNDYALAEEVIAKFSGKRGAQKLHDELYKLSRRDLSYQSRWGNIFQNLSKAIQDFWKHVGDSLQIQYQSKEEIADQILNDFAKQVNPVKKVERWLQERDQAYAAAVASGDTDRARKLFVEALQEHVGNGITPFVAVDGYRGKLDRLAHAVKNTDDHPDAIHQAADLMAPLIPANAVLVPAPSHAGYATDMLMLANVISERVHVPVADVLKSAPRERQYDVKKATGHPLTADKLGIRMEGQLPQEMLPVVIDNVVHSGHTAEACIKALGGGIVCALASAVSLERHASSLKSAQPVLYDKSGLLIPLSQRFELRNKYLGRSIDNNGRFFPTIVQGLESYSQSELERQVRQHVEDILSESFNEEDINIKKITLIGSRLRGEAHEDSDLDVLVEYEGEGVREDTLFNALNEEPLVINGIPVDINPINEHYSMNTEEWLARDARWREEDQQKQLKDSIMDKTDETKRTAQSSSFQNKYDAFVAKYHEGPLYAEVTIRFKGEKEEINQMIKLSSDIDQQTDDRIFFYCKDMKEFQHLMQSDNGEDFDIVHPDRITLHSKDLFMHSRSGEKQGKSECPQLSPIIKQFYDLKSKHPDAMLLFRCGDFYETYQQDAEAASKILGITVTKSNKLKGKDGKAMLMAGFPYHALDTYLPRLIRAGHRIAICDQLEAPRSTIKRTNDKPVDEKKMEVKEMVTPAKQAIEENPSEQKASVDENSEDETQPYKIHVGEAPTPDVFGEYHVDLGENINAVSYQEMQEIAAQMGGKMRIMNGHEWGDFLSEDAALHFANQVTALNQERMTSSQKGDLHNNTNTNFVSTMEEKKEELQKQEQMRQAEEQKQPDATTKETEGQAKKTGRWQHLDYSKYTMPEGATVEKANIWKMDAKDGEEHGKYAISAIINGERKTATLFPNDLNAYFSKEEPKKVTLSQLVAKYFAKSTAVAMGLAPAEQQKKTTTKNVMSQETKKTQEQKDKEKEAKEIKADQDAKEQKKKEENKETKEEAGEAIQVSLLVGALLAAKAKGGVWLNEKHKPSPGFYPSGISASPFNSMMMALHSDANGYKTNLYTNFAAAQKENISVARGEKGLPYNWYDFDKYVNKYNSNDVIDKEAYQTLSEEDKGLYKVQVSKDLRSVFNIDQTTMRSTKTEEYNALVPTTQNPMTLEQQFFALKKENPEQVLLFKEEDSFMAYNEDAQKIADVLGVTLFRKAGSQLEYKLEFPSQELDGNLKKMVSEGVSVSMVEQQQAAAQTQTVNVKVHQLVEAMKEAYGDKIMTLPENTHYDVKEDVLTIQAKNNGTGLSAALDHANDIYREAVAFTGGAERINRMARGKMLPEDAAKHEALVQELAAGVMMAREGLPAKISKSNLANISYWERELKENPKFIVSLERDVNNAVQVLDKVQRGEQVDYSAIRGEKNMESMQPQFYTISRDLANFPNEDTKEAVIIRDPKNLSAAVILPAGASLEAGNEIQGMNKARFVAALKKEGYENVQFYNAGGALGFVQPNEYFADKEMTVSKLKNHELITSIKMDYTDEIARTSDARIENLLAVKSQDNIMVFSVHAEGGKTYNIAPSQTDLNRFFASFKEGKSQDVKQELGKKYLALATEHPEMQVSLVPKVGNLDIARISSVSIAKDKFNDGKYIMFATIDGAKQKPVQISAEDYQRLWLVDDQKGYKLALASQLFGQKLGIDTSEDRTEETAQETGQEEQQKRNSGYHR